MIYLDIDDEIELQNVRNIVSEFKFKNIYEKNTLDSQDELNKKIKKSKIVICDDNTKKIDKYLELKKKVIVYIKARKSLRLIDELYFQKNVYTYSLKNELREILNYQKIIFQKIELLKMTSTIIIAIILFFCFSNTFSNKVPAEEDSLGNKLANENIKIELKPSKKDLLKYENIVFFGDSITEYYDLNKFYEQMPVINSGTSGFATNDLLDTIKEDVYIFNPTKVILLIGINDMNRTQDDNILIENIKKITKNIHEKRPKAKIYVESIYPVDRERYKILVDNNVDNERIRKVNKEIEKICKDNKYTYINIFDDLNDKQNDKIIYEYSKDGLHLSEEGYKVVTEKIKSFIEV